MQYAGRVHTRDRGVSFRIFSRVCQTNSCEPERQTVVTCPLTCLGIVEMTWASMGRGLVVMSLHIFLSLARLSVWTGSS